MKQKKLKAKTVRQEFLEALSIKIAEGKGMYIGSEDAQGAWNAIANAYGKFVEADERTKETMIYAGRTVLAAVMSAIELEQHREDMNQANWMRVATNGIDGTRDAINAGKDFSIEKHAKRLLGK